MATRTTAVGIDVGTYHIKVVVAAQDPKTGRIVVLGTGHAQSRGIRHGYIINRQEMLRALQSAIEQGERASGITIKHAYLSVGGVGLEEYRSRAELVISRVDNTVTDIDIKNVIEESEHKISSRLLNRKIIHAIPLSYRLDGERLIGRPLGMHGSRLGVDTLFITTLEQHLNDLIATVEDIGISVTDVMASPLAGSFVTLTKAQKIAGVVLANIGAETVSIAVFENDVPISVRVFPTGSTDITHDLALGLKLSLEDAEQVKCGALVDSAVSKRQLDTIVTARVSDIFTLIESHLKKLGKSGLLPAGIVLSGGGSGIATIGDIAQAVLKLPSSRASLSPLPESTKVRDSSWAVAYGLCLWGLKNNTKSRDQSFLKEKIQIALAWCKQFLP